MSDSPPEQDPLGAVRVWPRWQDRHHETDYAIRWTTAIDERRPWLLLGPDGPQFLSVGAVDGCERITLAELGRRLGEETS